MSRGRELIKNTVIIAFGKICTYFSTFLLIPLLTSHLTTGEYGLVDLITSYIVLLAPNLALQQELAVFRFLVDYRDDDIKIRETLTSSLSIVVKASIAVAVMSYIVLCVLNVPFSLLIILNVVVLMFSSFFLQVSRGLGKNNIFSIGSAIAGISNIALCCIFTIWLDAGVGGVFASSLLSNVICIVFLLFSLKLHKYINRRRASKKVSKKLVKYSLPLIPNSLSWWMINTSDRTIISSLLSISANGVYAVASKFPSIITSLYSIFGLSLMESASIHVDDKDNGEYFTNVLNASIKLFSSLSMGLIACMPVIFPIFVNSEYNEAYTYIPVIVMGSFLNCVVGTYSAILFAKKMTKKIMSTSMISAVINLVVDLLLVKIIGIYAAAISTIVAYLIMIVYRHVEIKHYIKIKINLKYVCISFIVFIFVCLSYYRNEMLTNAITLISLFIYALLVNRNILKMLVKKK